MSGVALTEKVLASHDASCLESNLIGDEEDKSIEEGSQTATSCANSSVFSLIETSNPVFGRVRKLWNSPLESHREV